MPETVTANQA